MRARSIPLKRRLSSVIRGLGRRRIWVSVACVVVCVTTALAWYLSSRRLPCEEGLVRFRRALEQADFDELYAMATDQDKTKLGVTRQNIEKVLRETVFAQARRVRTRPSIVDTPEQVMDRWTWRAIAIVDAQTGRPLPTQYHLGEYVCVVRMYQPKGEPWRVVMSDTLMSIYKLNHTRRPPEGPNHAEAMERRRQQVLRQMLAWGIVGTLGDPPYYRRTGGQAIVTGEPVIRLFDLSPPTRCPY